VRPFIDRSSFPIRLPSTIPVDREELREYTKARLRVLYEEELDVPLVLFNDVLDHVLQID
jgi:dynein heavy chain 1, cytosolic